MSDEQSLIAEALRLKAENPSWSYIRIGQTVGLHKDKVRRAVEHAERKKTNLPSLVEIEPRTASEYAERIAACWRKSVEAIFEVGRLLVAAKERLEHGQFEAMIETSLPFGTSTARRLMAVAADSRLSNRAHVHVLPPSWGTLYELTKLDDATLEARIADRTIRADMDRKEVENLVRGAPINGARSIMASRQEPDDSLDYFPTPPWATRALFEHAMPHLGFYWRDKKPQLVGGGSAGFGSVWEPACGEGHMLKVIEEYTDRADGSDIHDYGGMGADSVIDFLNAHDLDHIKYDWIITNPPFAEKATERFILRALDLASVGIAMFVRSQWIIEGVGRYERIFRDRPPTLIAFFSERVPLHKGRWEPDGATATAYCWLVWVMDRLPMAPFWIPPGCRKALSRPDDRAKFAAWSIPEAAE
jgi:hypothetical protein